MRLYLKNTYCQGGGQEVVTPQGCGVRERILLCWGVVCGFEVKDTTGCLVEMIQRRERERKRLSQEGKCLYQW